MEIVLDERNLKGKLTERDLEVYLSFGFVVRASAGTLVALRDCLKDMFSGSFSAQQLSSSNLYIVHWNDLCEESKRHFDKPVRRE